MKLTNEQAAAKIVAIDDSKIFSVKFVKRTNGEIRKMVCQKGVGKFVSGVGSAYDPLSKNLVNVFDVQHYKTELAAGVDEQTAGKSSYRSINLDDLVELKIDGETYQVHDFPITDWIASWTANGIDHSTIVKARTLEHAKLRLREKLGVTRLPRGMKIS